MKNILLSCALLAMGATTGSLPASAKVNTTSEAPVTVLVVGLDNNVSSNLYPKSEIASACNVPADSVSRAYNDILTSSLSEAGRGKGCRFVAAPQSAAPLLDDIHLTGDDEERYADISRLTPARYEAMLREAGADYLLVLGQHYLKCQERPMRTVFHITSCSLFDGAGREMTHASGYFTSVELESLPELSRDSRRSATRIATLVAKKVAARK